MKGDKPYMSSRTIHFGFGRIIVLLKRLNHSSLENFELLYYESRDMLPSHLITQLDKLVKSPSLYEDDFEFLEEIIQDLKALVVIPTKTKI